ncbi:MAG: hypothetical protein ABJD67_08475 [Qipengyuania citrea]
MSGRLPAGGSMMLDRQPLLDRAFAPSEVNGNIWSRPGKAIGSSECLLPAVGRLRPDSLLAAQFQSFDKGPRNGSFWAGSGQAGSGMWFAKAAIRVEIVYQQCSFAA